MADNNENVYFAADEPEKAVGTINSKACDWWDHLISNGYIEKIRNSWKMYYGVYFDDEGHSISFGGEQGELTQLGVNHYQNIAKHMLNMVTSTRPTFKARSTNTDYKSITQTVLANSLLDYYMREKRLERYFKNAVEYAIVLGSGYIKMEWNATSGEIYDYNEDLDTPIYEGDVEFKNLSPYDVVHDGTKESINEIDWVICRSFKNKYDIAAKYPEHKEKILEQQSKNEINSYVTLGRMYDETCDIPVYEFFHKRTESMENGRYLLYLSEDLVLLDSPMPYRDIPIYRISPSDIIGTAYGYSPMFDLIPLQEALNMLYTTVLSNQNAFGVQNVYTFRGSDISLTSLSSGLNVIEGNPVPGAPNAGIPVALNLTQTPGEIFNFMQQIVRDMEIISGINSTARGQAEAGVTSGNALALLQSQALQFISGLQQQYIQLIEDVGTGLINILRDFASVPRVAAIVGKTNKTEMKEFTGDDLDTVNRVIVDVGNALASTTAGRLQIADNLLQMGAITTPEQYNIVMTTGNLEVLTQNSQNEVMLIRAENERLTDGTKEVLAIATDNHALHIKEHGGVLADPDLRLDPDLSARTLNHINQHIILLKETNPDLLAFLGQQPLSPPGGTPVNPNNVPQPGMEGQAGPAGAVLENPEASTLAPPNQTLPNPASPPPVNDPRELK